VLRRRADLASAIRAGVAERVCSGKSKSPADAFAKLAPLDQILPSPPEWLIHQLALQWMTPTERATERGATLRLHLRDSFGRGTELQMLCAMAGLPVLPSSGNSHLVMRQYIFAAVSAYAVQQPDIFPPADSAPAAMWWEEDSNSVVPSMTPTIRAAIQRAVDSAVAEVNHAPAAVAGIMHYKKQN